eukprot:TRINITY_DN1450_c0_g1_i1.p2 TRINITY_DN1450_c0_g1~~TRINITY_DN1450_c0_g1_i1.p2  ORF type:complete len:167 (+),score=10.04 TRINITY_DN1450_c0_g1_i1:23-502(+)
MIATSLQAKLGLKHSPSLRGEFITSKTNKLSCNRTVSRRPLQISCARIAGVEIPNHKRTEIALTYIYGIGLTTAQAIMEDTEMENKRVRDLTEEELAKLRAEVEKYTIEGDLRRQIGLNIKRLQEIGCYRGRRHIMRLPCRGQKTKTNARTRKGQRGKK